MIGVVDYGIGNIKAFLNRFERLGVKAQRVSDIPSIKTCNRLILPGVGHFSQAMTKLKASNFIPTLEKMIINDGTPLLGVCVGMQMLSDYSEEGNAKGLGWIPGEVRHMRNVRNYELLRLPHMGWNGINIKKHDPLFTNILNQSNQFYFLHSFHFKPEKNEHILATSFYGFEFASIISNGNVYGMQCHPEKSHEWGTNILQNFSRL